MSNVLETLTKSIKKNGPFILKQTIVVISALAIASIVTAISGFKVTAIFDGMINALTQDLTGTLRWCVPLLFTGLACSVAFKAGIWNMGADGQLYIGAIIATTVALKFSFLPAYILLPAVVVGGMLMAALWGVLAGWLRVRFGANEVVTTLMLNYIAFYFSDYMVMGPLKGSGMYSAAQSSDVISESLWLPILFEDSNVSISLIVALILCVIVYLYMFKSPNGYEINMLGTNRAFALYGGIKINKAFIRTMAISGAIAGLAGVMEILGIHHRFPFRFTSNLGFDGMVVAILANNNPIGVILSAFFFAILRNGSYNIERMSDVPRSLVLVVQATIIIFAGAKFVMAKKRSGHSTWTEFIKSFFANKKADA